MKETGGSEREREGRQWKGRETEKWDKRNRRKTRRNLGTEKTA